MRQRGLEHACWRVLVVAVHYIRVSPMLTEKKTVEQTHISPVEPPLSRQSRHGQLEVDMAREKVVDSARWDGVAACREANTKGRERYRRLCPGHFLGPLVLPLCPCTYKNNSNSILQLIPKHRRKRRDVTRAAPTQ